MGSRLKENPERTFYWFFQASCPIARDKDPGLLFQFPEDFSDEECVQSLPRFCFPYDFERVRDGVAVQHFTFALTDLEGCQRFGFCRLTSSSQTCLCILSYLPWFEVFYKLLNNLADYVTRSQTNEMRELLVALYRHPVPPDNGSLTLQLIPYFIAPDPKALPSVPESRNLTELIVAVDVGNLMQLYASMLFERRILICCSKLSTLTACVHACSLMLFPMYWQHIFIPVLPPHLLDYCCAPMPYLIGVHSSLLERVGNGALDDVVILNVDTNTMESPHDDLKKLPADVVTGLKLRLKRQAAFPGSGVAQAFLRAQALLFGTYKDALVYPTEGPVSFNESTFLTHKSPCMRQFLQTAVHLQLFKQFIDGRLEMLNQGKEPDDLFEEEIQQCGLSSGGSKSYQQWLGNLKKGGGSLILTVKSKAQIYKNVKCSAMFGKKNLGSSKEKHTLQRGGSVCGTHSYRFNKSDCLQSRLPITQHFGKSRPRRPSRKPASQQGEDKPQDQNSSGSWEQESNEELVSEDLTEEEENEFSMMGDLEKMDLLGEIFDTLNSQSATEPGLLYSTRSLDLFGSDCTDFISRRSLATPSQESLSLSIGNNGSLKSWEESLEEGPAHVGEEPEALQKESERQEGKVAGGGYETLGQEKPPVDLERLVDNFVDLGMELEEELNGKTESLSGEVGRSKNQEVISQSSEREERCTQKEQITISRVAEETKEPKDDGLKNTRETSDDGLKNTRGQSDDGLKNTRETSDDGLKNTRKTSDDGLRETQGSSDHSLKNTRGTTDDDLKEIRRSSDDSLKNTRGPSNEDLKKIRGSSDDGLMETRGALDDGLKETRGLSKANLVDSQKDEHDKRPKLEQQNVIKENPDSPSGVTNKEKDIPQKVRAPENITNEVETEEEVGDKGHITPKVLSAVAIFQSKACQAKSSSETGKPGISPRGSDAPVKVSISPKGPGTKRITGPKTDDVLTKCPLTTTADLATQDEELPPPKVSELKKRFEH